MISYDFSEVKGILSHPAVYCTNPGQAIWSQVQDTWGQGQAYKSCSDIEAAWGERMGMQTIRLSEGPLGNPDLVL